jgi:predicted permease
MARLWVAGRVFVGRLRLLARRDRLDDELRDEVRLHLDLRRQALIDAGMDPRQADVEARRIFGNAMAIREETRDMWGFPSLDTLVQDIRYGVRLLRRSPTVTIAAIVSLAIGIGASAGVFSLIDAMLLRSLPVRAPQELLVFQWHSGPTYPYSSLSGYSWGDDTGERSTSFSLRIIEQSRLRAQDVVDVFGFADLYQASLSVGGVAEVGEATAVTGNYFGVLGISATHGRLLVESDDRAGASPAAVISDALWKRRFDGAPGAVGRTLVINAVPFTVVGVAPASFAGTGQLGSSPEVFVPLAAKEQLQRNAGDSHDPNNWWVLMMGRLKAGVTAEAARGRLDLILKQAVHAARPDIPDKDLPRIEALAGAQGQIQVRDGTREPLKMMSIVVVTLLLVACANVANLLLARGRARVRELSVRIALGAPRHRVVRQLLTEGVILAGCGSVVGLLAAQWVAGTLMPALDDGSDPVRVMAGLSFRLVGFIAGLASVCVVLFALVPALRATDMSLVAGLHEAGRGSANAPRRRGLSATLVVAQITLSMVLVATALLLVRSVHQLQQVDLGFDAGRILTFRLDPGLNGYPSERVFDIYARVLERLRAAPGVNGATLSSHTLISNSANIILAARSDDPVPERGSPARAAFTRSHRAWRLAVDSQFFATMGIALERGRTFDDRDAAGSQPVAVVNYALARQLFNTDDVVGRSFRTESMSGAPAYEIVGVCKDALYTSLRDSKTPTMYVTYRQRSPGSMTLEVRTAGDPATFVATAREIVRSVDRNVPMFKVQSQDEQVAASVNRERLFATLAAGLGVVALLLSAIGLYALLAYTVTLRTGEIGIRMALGADRRDVRWMIVRHSLHVGGWGLALGVVASIAGTELLRSLLFNVEPRDASTLAVAGALILSVALIAGYIPARRASQVDPLTALRAE